MTNPMSAEELAAERLAIAKARAALRNQEQSLDEKEGLLEEEQRKWWLAHIDEMLALRPLHDRSSCSDESLINDGRCDRCTLLQIKQDDYWSPRVRVELHVVIQKE